MLLKFEKAEFTSSVSTSSETFELDLMNKL